MGKCIIIKGVDFSDVAIKRLRTYTSNSTPTTQTTSDGGKGWIYADDFISKFRNKEIISISFYIKQPGKLDVILVSKYGSVNANVSIIKSVTVYGTGYQKITFDKPIILKDTETIGMNHDINGTVGAAIAMYANNGIEHFGALTGTGAFEDYTKMGFGLPCIIDYY